MSQSVVYATKTGHSQKLADAISKAIQVRAENVTAIETPRPAELLFIIGGIYAGKSLPELTNYAKKIRNDQVKNVVLVTSSVSTSQRSQSDIRRVLTENGIKVLDEITCPGSLLFIKSGHPDAADLKTVAERAKQIAEKYI